MSFSLLNTTLGGCEPRADRCSVTAFTPSKRERMLPKCRTEFLEQLITVHIIIALQVSLLTVGVPQKGITLAAKETGMRVGVTVDRLGLVVPNVEVLEVAVMAVNCFRESLFLITPVLRAQKGLEFAVAFFFIIASQTIFLNFVGLGPRPFLLGRGATLKRLFFVSELGLHTLEVFKGNFIIFQLSEGEILSLERSVYFLDRHKRFL
jgi:hypothetical protein